MFPHQPNKYFTFTCNAEEVRLDRVNTYLRDQGFIHGDAQVQVRMSGKRIMKLESIIVMAPSIDDPVKHFWYFIGTTRLDNLMFKLFESTPSHPWACGQHWDIRQHHQVFDEIVHAIMHVILYLQRTFPNLRLSRQMHQLTNAHGRFQNA